MCTASIVTNTPLLLHFMVRDPCTSGVWQDNASKLQRAR